MGGIEGPREDGVRIRGLGPGLSPDAKGLKSLGGNEAKGTSERIGFIGM